MSETDKPRPPWWMYLIAASLVLAFCLNWWNVVMGPQPAGFTRHSQFNLQTGKIVPGSPFDKAGMHDGDTLVAVNGKKLESVLDWDFIRTTFEPDKPFQLDVLRGQQTLRLTVVLPPHRYRQFEATDYINLVSIAFAQAMLLALALLIILKRPFDLSARLAAWLFSSIAVFTPPNYGGVSVLHQLPLPLSIMALAALALPISAACAWFCFFASFPKRLLTKPWHWLLAILPGVFYLPWIIVLGRAFFAPDQVIGSFTLQEFLVFALFAFLQELAGLGILLYHYFHSQDVNERRKVGVLFAGTTVGWISALAAVIPASGFALHGAIQLAGAILFLSFPLSFAYAIMRHRVFDLGVILRQGLQYTLARGVVVWALPAAIALFLLDVAATSGDIGIAAIGHFFANSPRGWFYAVIGTVALVAQRKRQEWLLALDKRFFRERYNAQQLLRQAVEEIRASQSLKEAGPRIVAQIEAALHPDFAALMVREENQPVYMCQAIAPAGCTLPPLAADSKLMAAFRLFAKPLQVSLSESGWLKKQLPHADTEFLRQARIDLMVPVTLSANGREALLSLGQKRSEEPYSGEDNELLLAIANSLALLLERPMSAHSGSGLEECPQCGDCYDSGAIRCKIEGAKLVASPLPRLLSNRYRLEKRLGRGGMGTVYKALDTSLDREVALKLIRDDLVTNPEIAERFKREAKAAAALSHPNLVTVYDFGVDADTRAFLIMELLDGVTLRQEIQRQKRLTPQRTLEILRVVCSAVEAAHQKQIIHRDLKAENIFLALSGGNEVPKVLDFGLAKFLNQMDSATTVTPGTRAGMVVGTPQYMSPEQLRGEAASVSWDVWALTVIAYEALTGAHPFADGTSIAQVHHAIANGRFTPVAQHFPEATVQMNDFFQRGFSMDSSERPQSVTVFWSALEKALA